MSDRSVVELIRSMSADAVVPDDLAQRALVEHRRRVRRRLVAPVSLLAVVGLAWATFARSTGEPVRIIPASDAKSAAVSADTTHYPAQTLVSAGEVAVGAMYRITGSDDTDRTWVWRVIDRRTDRYVDTDWAWVAVAPGLRQAAVLEGPLPSSRVGLLDLVSGKVAWQWTGLDHPVAGLAWSPDGTRLLATAYDRTPDGPRKDNIPIDASGHDKTISPRTGFWLLDLDSGAALFHRLPGLTADVNGNARQDFGWSRDGSAIWGPTGSWDLVFYHLTGRLLKKANVRWSYLLDSSQSAVSPDGDLALDGDPGLPTSIVATSDGHVVGKQPVEELLAWADETHVVARGCGACGDEFRNGLVLVNVDGTRITPLTRSARGPWQFVLVHR